MTSRKPHGGGRVARPDAWSPDTAWRVAFTLSSAAAWTVSSSSRACCPALSTRVIEPLVASCLIRHCPWAACLGWVGSCPLEGRPAGASLSRPPGRRPAVRVRSLPSGLFGSGFRWSSGGRSLPLPPSLCTSCSTRRSMTSTSWMGGCLPSTGESGLLGRAPAGLRVLCGGTDGHTAPRPCSLPPSGPGGWFLSASSPEMGGVAGELQASVRCTGAGVSQVLHL